MKDQWEKVVVEYENTPGCRMAKITEAEDTALHLAVSGGKLEFVNKMVELLGDKAKEVLKAKNKRGNTPLHTAAALGNARISRDENGDTILHAAINGEHFDLAFQIICKYLELLETVNENGFSPLHVLATKTNAFKSGSRLGLFDRIIVDELKEQKIDSKDYLQNLKEKDDSHPSLFPQNYETCVRFFQRISDVLCYNMPSEFSSPRTKPESNNSNSAVKRSSDTGTGFQRIRKIITKKQRHTWATQVMNKLVENASSMYRYSVAKAGIGNIGDMTKEFPLNPSHMMSSSHDQDTDKGDTKHSHVGTLNKQGEYQN
ncbi:hypothetical protein PTKIN_Ptkin09bG0226500 [Pterospermum kingtungense]